MAPGEVTKFHLNNLVSWLYPSALVCRRLEFDLADDVDAGGGRRLEDDAEILVVRLPFGRRNVQAGRLQDDLAAKLLNFYSSSSLTPVAGTINITIVSDRPKWQVTLKLERHSRVVNYVLLEASFILLDDIFSTGSYYNQKITIVTCL